MRATQSLIPAFGVRLQLVEMDSLNFRFFDFNFLSNSY